MYKDGEDDKESDTLLKLPARKWWFINSKILSKNNTFD